MSTFLWRVFTFLRNAFRLRSAPRPLTLKVITFNMLGKSRRVRVIGRTGNGL